MLELFIESILSLLEAPLTESGFHRLLFFVVLNCL
jgi:hypothetical protein